jgi:hypothetical protein
MEQPNESGRAGKYTGEFAKRLASLEKDPDRLAHYKRKRQQYNAAAYARRMADPVKQEKWRQRSREAMQKQRESGEPTNSNNGA